MVHSDQIPVRHVTVIPMVALPTTRIKRRARQHWQARRGMANPFALIDAQYDGGFSYDR